ncbi:MAG: hypothetical protein PW843_24380 [Azospirillaceae bacterium]|nr:hypothetical protein [Azospirillaceae bacterium]
MIRTAQFDELVEEVGITAATALSRQWGGRGLYIAHKPGPSSPLAAVVGMQAAQLLARRYGGTELAVPISQGRRSQVWQLRCEGASVRQIAKTTGYTERAVYYILAEQDPEAGEPPLLALMGKV